MRLYPFAKAQSAGTLAEEDYKTARAIGKIRMGKSFLYFRSGVKTYYLPYEEVQRCFRRVEMVPAKLCCGRGELADEKLVICTSGGELAQVELPDTRAARILMEELRVRIPDAEFSCPKETTGEDA